MGEIVIIKELREGLTAFPAVTKLLKTRKIVGPTSGSDVVKQLNFLVQGTLKEKKIQKSRKVLDGHRL